MAEEQEPKPKPMPVWIKNLTVPASTKQYLYERWLTGELSPAVSQNSEPSLPKYLEVKDGPFSLGAIPMVAEELKDEFIDLVSGRNLEPPTNRQVVKDKISPEQALKEKFEKFKTLKELEDNLEVLKKQKAITDYDIKNATDWLNLPNAATTRDEFNAKNGTNYSLTEFRSMLPKLKDTQKIQQKSIEQAAFVLKEAKSQNKSALVFLEDELKIVKKERDVANLQFQKGLIDLDALKAAEQNVFNIEIDKKRIKDDGELAFSAVGGPNQPARYSFRYGIRTGAPATGATGKTGATTTTTPGATTTSGGFTKTQVEKLLSTSGPGATTTGAPATGAPGATTPGAPGAPGATATGTTGAPATGAPGATATGTTGKTTIPGKKTVPGKTVPGKTGVTAPIDNAWETTFRQTFPAKAWLLDLDRTKYPQLFQLLNTAISQEWYKSPEGLSRFTASLDGTDFYKEISTSKQLKTIQSLVGTLGFEGSDFTKFVSDSINFGYEGDILKQKVYSEVFKKDDAGNYVNPTALSRTKKSADYISTQNIAKAFFNRNPADSDIEKVLTGQMLAADYERQQREFAKSPGRYGHLSNLLDQGMTMESIASAYKTTAARLLELNPNAIDMSTGAFEKAVTFGEEGKKRLMTNSEWENLLRTDAQYGWERTNNAKDEARSLSANIAQAFGRIL